MSMSHISQSTGTPLKRPWVLRHPLLSGLLTGVAFSAFGYLITTGWLDYRDREPHIVSVCTASHTEMLLLPSIIPNGNGGFTTIIQLTPINACDSGYNVCQQKGKQVDWTRCSGQ